MEALKKLKDLSDQLSIERRLKNQIIIYNNFKALKYKVAYSTRLG